MTYDFLIKHSKNNKKKGKTNSNFNNYILQMETLGCIVKHYTTDKCTSKT